MMQDATEGPMPQTKFVLSKALKQGTPTTCSIMCIYILFYSVLSNKLPYYILIIYYQPNCDVATSGFEMRCSKIRIPDAPSTFDAGVATKARAYVVWPELKHASNSESRIKTRILCIHFFIHSFYYYFGCRAAAAAHHQQSRQGVAANLRGEHAQSQ